MKAGTIYGMLATAGAAVPLAAFLPWLALHGPDLPLFAHDLFANRVAAFFGLDVIVSALVLFVSVLIETRRAAMRHGWLPILATCLIGVSCGLPLFLALREAARSR
jgi:hypothetical protein